MDDDKIPENKHHVQSIYWIKFKEFCKFSTQGWLAIIIGGILSGVGGGFVLGYMQGIYEKPHPTFFEIVKDGKPNKDLALVVQVTGEYKKNMSSKGVWAFTRKDNICEIRSLEMSNGIHLSEQKEVYRQRIRSFHGVTFKTCDISKVLKFITYPTKNEQKGYIHIWKPDHQNNGFVGWSISEIDAEKYNITIEAASENSIRHLLGSAKITARVVIGKVE